MIDQSIVFIMIVWSVLMIVSVIMC